MKAAAALLALVLLTGCASMQSRCLRNAALSTGLAAGGGYALSMATASTKTRVDQTVTMTGEIHNTYHEYQSGWLYDNRGAAAVTMGLTAGIITLAACPR